VGAVLFVALFVVCLAAFFALDYFGVTGIDAATWSGRWRTRPPGRRGHPADLHHAVGVSGGRRQSKPMGTQTAQPA
jgi:hypothetical protein